jgi:hypothetical protein
MQSPKHADIGGEVPHQKFPRYIVLHPTQLLGHAAGPPEMGNDVLPLALLDEAEGLVDALRQIHQGAAHGWVHRRLIKLLEDFDNPGDAPLDVVALLLVLLNRVDSLLDLGSDFDDLLHAAERDTGHLALAAPLTKITFRAIQEHDQ